jgi:hypothetical protein
MCAEAVKLLDSGRIPRRRGRLIEIARKLKVQFHNYDVDSIRRHIYPTVREWENGNPGK